MAVFLRNAHSLLNPLCEAAVALARTEMEHGVPGKDLLALAAGSAEFDAAINC
jgi:hypothetical protein